MLRFYSLLGLKFEEVENSKGGQIYRTQVGDTEFTIFATSRIGKSIVPTLHMAFKVPNVDKILPQLYEIDGVMNVLDPTKLDAHIKAIILDPDGHSVELIEALEGQSSVNFDPSSLGG